MLDWITGIAAWELLALEPPGWGGVLLKGLAVSLQVAVGGYILGFLIGIGGATGKLYGGPILRDVLDVYTTLVRAVPELVLILLLYYAGTDALNKIMILMGAERTDISGLAAGIFVIGVVQGAYQTEVLRGAFKAAPYGQIEAARAYGMSPFTAFRRIWLPRAIHRALPTLAGETVLQLKATPLVATITVVDVYAIISRVRQDTFLTYEPLLLLALIYMILTGVLVVAFR
jgi:polar amino acid transport system permease protein